MFVVALITFFPSFPLLILSALADHPVIQYFSEGVVLLLEDHSSGLFIICFHAFVLACIIARTLGYEMDQLGA
ncbi:hypothetical protein PMAYCL1PPCAC_03363 [Pristionchus mayeri]|uniref:G protein-coupled receptor n=1 Tax=Pristionchus mayeri TaxID=1317129 RepID=A0AAN5C1D1_9BILA|nr:hypothetical protein PMAYCL1PPCAC_03363 [Pristionchus mayeri]